MHRVTCLSAAYAVDLGTSTTRTTGPRLTNISVDLQQALRDGRFLGTTNSLPCYVSATGSADPCTSLTCAAPPCGCSASRSATKPASNYGGFVHTADQLGYATAKHFSADGQSSHRCNSSRATTLGHDYAAAKCVSPDSQSHYVWSYASTTSLSHACTHGTARCHDASPAYAINTALRATAFSSNISFPNTFTDG